MLRQLFSIVAKKAAATAIVGTVVVFTGTFALASIAEGDGTELELDELEQLEELEELVCIDECPDDQGDEGETEEEETAGDDNLVETQEPFDLGAVFDEESELEDDGETDGTDGYRNHGEAVSEAARETCPKGPGHGQCVSDVAKSDAGKKDKKNKHADDAAEEEVEGEEDDDDEEDVDEGERSERKAQHEADKQARKADKRADKAARHGAKHDS